MSACSSHTTFSPAHRCPSGLISSHGNWSAMVLCPAWVPSLFHRGGIADSMSLYLLMLQRWWRDGSRRHFICQSASTNTPDSPTTQRVLCFSKYLFISLLPSMSPASSCKYLLPSQKIKSTALCMWSTENARYRAETYLKYCWREEGRDLGLAARVKVLALMMVVKGWWLWRNFSQIKSLSHRFVL